MRKLLLPFLRCFSFFLYFSVPSYPNWKYRLPTTSELAEQEQTLLRKPIKEGLNSVPTTQKEKTDCAILLSPSQLFKVVVGKLKISKKKRKTFISLQDHRN